MAHDNATEIVADLVRSWASAHGLACSSVQMGDTPATAVDFPIGAITFRALLVAGSQICFAIVPEIGTIAKDGADDPLLPMIAALNFAPGIYRIGVNPEDGEIRLIVASAMPSQGPDSSLVDVLLSGVGLGLTKYLQALEAGARLG